MEGQVRFLLFRRYCEVFLLLLAAIAAALTFCYLAPSSPHGVYWVGFRDLEVTFVVTDAETGDLIAGAQIDIPKNEPSFCSDCEGPYTLVTDTQGSVRRTAKHCMCFGYSGRSWFRRLETYGSHAPDWEFQVSSPGYRRSEWISLHEQEFRRTIQRGGEFATMDVSVRLQRLPDEKQK
jgi:hypothetical protein